MICAETPTNAPQIRVPRTPFQPEIHRRPILTKQLVRARDQRARLVSQEASSHGAACAPPGAPREGTASRSLLGGGGGNIMHEMVVWGILCV